MNTGFAALFQGVVMLVLAVAVFILVHRLRRLKQERDDLLKEKDVTFGFIHDIGEVFADTETVDIDRLLNRVLYYAMRTSRAGAGAIYLVDPELHTLSARAVSGLFPPLFIVGNYADDALNRSKNIEHLVRTQPIPRGEGIVGETAKYGAPLLIEDAERDPRVPNYQQDFLRIHSALSLPMRFHQNVLGVLVVVNRVDGQPFIQADLSFLQALADQAAVSVHYAGLREALDEKQRFDHDLDVARKIQTALLPRSLPDVEGVEVAAFNEPALEIGGDYYDFIQVDADHLGIAIADVSGKGVGGAIMMSVCRSVLHAYAPGNASPADVLRAINRAMTQDISEDMFVSMLYMVLNRSTRELVIARAGHERPILRSGNGSGFSVIDSPGIAVGIADPDCFDSVLQEKRVQLASGDSVVAYTDGVTEAMNQTGDEWGVDNFMESLQVATEEGVGSIMNNVRQRLGRFVGDQPQYDDMTLLALRVLR